MGLRVHEMVGNPVVEVMAVMIEVMVMVTVMVKVTDNDVKVVQDVEPGKVEPGAPERVGDPCVEVPVVPRRRIIGYDRWALLGVVVVNDRRLHIFVLSQGLGLCLLTGCRA